MILGGTDWQTVLLEATAAVLASIAVLVSVVVGARIYREGAHDHRPDPRDREPDDEPTDDE